MNLIQQNLDKIRAEIIKTSQKVNRNPEDVKLVAVSKRFPVNVIEEAAKAGQLVFGENYIQEANEKFNRLDKSTPAVKLHFIGHIQSNKAKIAASISHMIETVDRLKLARALNKHLSDLNKDLDILVQVNIGDDKNKSGVKVEKTAELLAEIKNHKLHHLQVRGLMTIPPFTPEPEEARKYFRALRQHAMELAKKELFANNEKIELSMGMSKDYHIAIEEGATLVRIGTALFGDRPS